MKEDRNSAVTHFDTSEAGSGPSSVRISREVQPMDLGASTPTPPPSKKFDPYVGKTIDGRYLIEDVLGEGGMGIVYKGRHKVIDKRVAIKVLRGEMAKDTEITERFLQEARAASAIGNPHIIDISDFGQLPDGSTYFVMEFLDGKSLTDLMNGAKRLPVPRLCHIAKQMAQGLAAAHAANIIHRDLKPDNVMLVSRGTEKDFVKVLDFGIAKVGTGGSKMTKAGSVFGTPHYMSPEQAAGATVDSRTDVYSLGVILYELASGKVPFDADNFMGILTQHMYKSPVPIRALVPQIDVPPGLDAIIMKSLTKKPEGRYASMTELVADLEKLEKGLMPDAVQEMMARSGGFNVPADYFRSSAMPAPVPATPSGLPRKTRWPLYVAIAAVCSGAGVAAVIVAGGGGTSAASSSTAAAISPKATEAAPTTTQATAPATTSATATAPVVAANAPTKIVTVLTDPSEVSVTRDGKLLGPSPWPLELREGEDVTLELSKAGYETTTVHVTSEKLRPLFKLKKTAPVATGGGTVRVPPTSTSTTTTTVKPPAPANTDLGPLPPIWNKGR